MERLLSQCWFRCESLAPPYEGVAQKLDVNAVNAVVERGRATLTALNTLAFRHSIRSLSVKEGTQSDTEKLPCGARSLLLDSESGEIVVRGVNKFFDVAAVSGDDAWCTDATLWRTCRVWAQRKMAGFVVTVFSLDGRTLQLISKHAAEGVHVDMARRVLDTAVSRERQHKMAQALWERRLALSCECILRREDCGHPVLEDTRFDQRLVAFAVQARDSVAELALPIDKMTHMVAEWGLPVAPSVELLNAVELHNAVRCTERWSGTMRDLGLGRAMDTAQLAEGLVIIVEVPPAQGVASSAGAWVRPVRLKAKTVQYVVLRTLRTVITGESSVAAASQRGRTYHRAVLAWAAEKSINVPSEVESTGIFALHNHFVHDIAEHNRKRLRGATTPVGGAYRRLIDMTEKECAPLSHVPLTVVLLTGLPGSGKTTAAAHLVTSLTETRSPFEFIVHLSRDSVTREIAEREQLNEQSSKHKLRRLRGLVHKSLMQRLDDIVTYSKVFSAPGLVVLDACHASAESRAALRMVLPARLDMFLTVHLHCSDGEEALRRLASRTDHAVIHDPHEAQRALYSVRRKFVAPSAAEAALMCDTTTTLPDDIARQIRSRVANARPGGATPTRREPSQPLTVSLPTCALTTDVLAARLVSARTEVLQSLVGERGLSMLVASSSVGLPLATRRSLSVQIVLYQTTHEALLLLASRILHAVLADPHQRGSAHTLVGSLLRSVKALVGRHDTQTPSFPLSGATLVAGHLKWLPNWLFGRNKGRDVGDFVSAVRDRFDAPASQPHVTLFYATQKTPAARADAVAAWWVCSQLIRGSAVNVHLRELLIDRLGISFRAALPDGRECQWAEGADGFVNSPRALHVTIGVAADAPSAYCGEMSHLFTEWQAANEALELHKANKTAVRSKEKFHNFARLAFEPVPLVSGVVAELG